MEAGREARPGDGIHQRDWAERRTRGPDARGRLRHDRLAQRARNRRGQSTLEATQGQIDGFFSQLPPESGGICGRLTYDLPLGCLRLGAACVMIVSRNEPEIAAVSSRRSNAGVVD